MALITTDPPDPVPDDPLLAGHPYLAGLAKIAEGLDEMLAAGFAGHDPATARAVLLALESQSRRVEAVRVAAVDAIDAGRFHRLEGHRSAAIMVRHHGRLSRPTAQRLDQSARALRDLPSWKAAFEAGLVSADYVALMARAWANPRVRDALIEAEGWFLDHALDRRFDHLTFERLVLAWVDRVDEDGAGDRHQRNHRNRNVTLTQDHDTSWNLSGGGGANDGAELRAILDRFIDEQFQADWNDAKERHGDIGDIDGLAQHLERTPQQRRWDALMEMARRASSTLPGQNGSQVVTNIVIDHRTFERYTAAHTGAPLTPDDPRGPGRRCETIDGHPVEPATAIAAALIGHIRRVVVDARSVVIDMSRKTRLFRDHAALAAKMTSIICYWPGCWTHVTHCQTDHLTEWHHGGHTDQDNAAPPCGHHNRLRNYGYHAHRNPDGTIAIHDPNDNPIT